MTFSWQEIQELKVREMQRISIECDSLVASGVNCSDLRYRLDQFFREASDMDSSHEDPAAVQLCQGYDFKSEESLSRLKGTLLSASSLNCFLAVWAKNRLPCFSSAIVLQAQLEAAANELAPSVLWEFCATQWQLKYTSWKSWIIRILGKASGSFDLAGFRSSLIASLLRRRFTKGKLIPLRGSVVLAQVLEVEVPSEFIDEELSALNDLLEEIKKTQHGDFADSVKRLKELEASSGCHCD